MIAQSKILPHSELFTAYLQSVNDIDGQGSFYTFGYIDRKVVKASGQTIHYTPVDNSNGFWQIASTAYSVNGAVFNRSGNMAIMDTGTTLALVDDQTCSNIYSQIPGAKLDTTQGVSFNSLVLCEIFQLTNLYRVTSSRSIHHCHLFL